MPTIKDLIPDVDPSIADVNVRWDGEADKMILESDDREALTVAVCTAIRNGWDFESGDADRATMIPVEPKYCQCRAIESGMECDAVEYMNALGIEWKRCGYPPEYMIPDSGLRLCPDCRNGCYNGEGLPY